jgi:caa(3)-type oxidase subunit IV
MTSHAAHAPGAHAPHSNAHYVKIWAVLCVLLAISILGPFVGIKVVTMITAFGVAIVKAYLVAKNFMHLNIERRWVVYIFAVMFAFILVMFGGIAPDVLKHDGAHWHKTYVEPVVAPEGAHAE